MSDGYDLYRYGLMHGYYTLFNAKKQVFLQARFLTAPVKKGRWAETEHRPYKRWLRAIFAIGSGTVHCAGYTLTAEDWVPYYGWVFVLIGTSSFPRNRSIVLWVAGRVRKSAIHGSRKYACFSRGRAASTSGGIRRRCQWVARCA